MKQWKQVVSGVEPMRRMRFGFYRTLLGPNAEMMAGRAIGPQADPRSEWRQA